MAVPDTLHIEMMLGAFILDTYSREILDTYGRNILDLGWVDVQEDVLTDSPTTIFQGQKNGDAVDRVADAGTIKLEMNNNSTNSGGLVGYYSTDNINKRVGFENGLRVRIGYTKDSVTEWISEGRIIDIKPVPGLLNNKVTHVTCGDWIEVASRTPMPRIAIQESCTDDSILQAILNALDDAPQESDLSVGPYTYEYALTDVQDEETKIISVLQSIAQSGTGRIFITGGTTSGEVLKYVDLYSLLSVVSPVAAFNDSFMDTDVQRRANRRVKRVVVTGYPQTKDASPVVLYTNPQEIQIAAGDEIEFSGSFRDPNASSSRSVAAVNVVEPVVNTDYKFSSISGSGTDLNASLTITLWEVGARTFRIKMRNDAVSAGYLWFQQVRGEGLYPYDTITYTAVDSTVKEGEGVTLNYDLPYHSNYYTIKSIGDALLAWYNVDITSLPYIDFVPSATEEDFTKFKNCKPGEVVAISESVSGVSQSMVVIGRDISIWHAGTYITERLYLMPVQQVESSLFFTLDTLGQDDLDGTNTLIAFG